MAQSRYSAGIGFSGALFITFLVLKLCGVIDWSWWWVTCPLWIGFAIAMVVFGMIGIVVLIVGLLK